MLKGNKGEWSELYAFCYLLNEGVLKAADKDLNPTTDVFFPIIKILREETRGIVLDYFPYNDETNTIRIFSGETLIGEFSRDDFVSALRTLLDKIPTGERAFEIPETDDFFNSIFVHKLKADSAHKQDIDIQIHDIHTGISPVCGFSIKSYLGSRPTLVNPGKSTNLVYIIENCSDEIAAETNSITTRTKIVDRIHHLLSKGCKIVPSDEMVSAQFRENLEFVDSLMPKIVSHAVLSAFLTGNKKIATVINQVSRENPMHYTNLNMYAYKFKKLLCACALGMTPEKHWEGAEDANGGYIVVKRDGSVVCYHIYNRTEFEQYLFDYTCFDTPSTGRYEFMDVYKEDGFFKLKLNLQIRFV